MNDNLDLPSFIRDEQESKIKSSPIVLRATLNKIATTIDGGWRITFDVSQSDIEQIKELATQREQLFQMALVPNDSIISV